MAKSNGIKSLKQAAKLLNRHAPDGESLAYINPTEARILKAHGGSGIMTLQGVPSYESKWYNPFSWDWSDKGTAGKVWNYITGRYEDQAPVYKDDKMIQRGQSGVGNLVQDAISIYGFLRAKKDQEGLNEAETAEFNRLQAQLTASQEQFTEYTDSGTQLKAPQNVPQTIEDVSVFKETTGRPDMITTAAQGGRIGFNSGSQGNRYRYLIDKYNKGIPLTPSEAKELEMLEITYTDVDRDPSAQGGRIGYNLGGIGAMDPRMGYQRGSPHGVEIPTFSEGVEQMYESGPAGVDTETINWEREQPFLPLDETKSTETINWDRESPYAIDMKQEDVSTIGGNQIQETVMTLINSGIVGDTREALEHAHILNEYEINSPGVTKLALSFINSGIVGDVREAIEQALIIMRASQTQGNAHGGRIGAAGGGIMPLLNMGGMEKDYRQDGGFVPIGRKEKADDVPARLSKNEFVFTADAVRAAGGGDIDEGAQRMYNVMKNLEAGGDISEQSQGQG